MAGIAAIMLVDWEEFRDRTATVAEVRLLGCVDLPSVIALQKLMMHEVRQQSRTCAAVLICEHPPVVSAGTDTNLLQLPLDPRELESRLISVHRVRREGGAILHQPGNLAAYVIVSLEESGSSPDQHREQLRTAVLGVCHEQQVIADVVDKDVHAVAGRHGVIAEVVVGLESGVTSYGIFLNVSGCIEAARQVGRGLLGQRISSLDAERVRPVLRPQLRASLIQHVTTSIGYPEYHIHTGHPFLKRTRTLIHDTFADH